MQQTPTNVGRPRERSAEPAGRESGRVSVHAVVASVQPIIDATVSVGLLMFFVVLLVRVSRTKHDPPADQLESKD